MSVIKPLSYYSLHLLLGFKSLEIVFSLQFLIITLQMSSLFLYMFSTCWSIYDFFISCLIVIYSKL